MADYTLVAGLNVDSPFNSIPIAVEPDGCVLVAPCGGTFPITGTVTVLQGTVPWVVSGTVSIVPAATGINLYGENGAVVSGVETTILSYTNTGITWVTHIIAWGTYDGEFLLRKNGTIVGGGRTSTADRTLDLLYNNPIPTTIGDVILVTVLYYNVNTSGLQQFRCNLMGQ